MVVYDAYKVERTRQCITSDDGFFLAHQFIHRWEIVVPIVVL